MALLESAQAFVGGGRVSTPALVASHAGLVTRHLGSWTIQDIYPHASAIAPISSTACRRQCVGTRTRPGDTAMGSRGLADGCAVLRRVCARAAVCAMIGGVV